MKQQLSNLFRRPALAWLFFAVCALVGPFSNAAQAATVTTDKLDYAPGSTAYVTGSGFEAGETVQFQVLHADGTPDTGEDHEPWFVTDGGAGDLDGIADGNILTTWHVCEDDCVGATLELTATGLTSGSVATTQFTDANDVTVTPATGGGAISADTVGGTYTALTGPILQENGSGAIGTGTIILNAPSGFIFDTSAAVTVLVNSAAVAGHNINNLANGSTIAATVTTTTITITITSKSNSADGANKLTWQNIRVRPTAGTPLASGNITRSTGGGNSSFTLATGSPTTYGALTEVPGALHHFNIATISSPQLCGAAFNISITAQDQFNNTVTGFAGTVNLSSTAGTISPTVSGAFSGGLRTQSVTITGTACLPGHITVTRTGGAETGSSNDFTVTDTTPPVITSIPANTTVSCANLVPAPNDGAVVATDGCGGAVTITHDADVITPGSCANRYSIARTYHATDVCGNSSSMTQTITVNDTTPPMITSIPADTTVSCANLVAAPNDGAVVATDGCGGVVTITHDADMITPGSCANRYTITRKYHATDVCGNSSSMTQTITVDDQTAPSITSIPANTTVSCVGDVPAPNDAAVVATDGCAGAVTITHDADMITPGSCANRYTIARKYHATDVCGNSSSMTQTITVDDQTAPSITSIPANTTVSCVSDVPAPNDAAVVATDGCAGAVTITHDADMITPGSCANRYTIARKYHATDVCGNSSSMTQTITVDDQIAPSITSIPANTTVSCVSDVPAPNDGAVVATDGCGGAVTITHDADMITPGSCANRYTIARKYHATDVCGNSSSMTQTITVDDQIAPSITSIPANTTVSCVSDVPAPNDGAVVATDGCGGAVTITHDADMITPGSCANRYTIARKYHATDVCGNSSSMTQTITVDDQTAPSITSIPANTTVSCVSDVPAPNDGAVVATDGCGGAVTITHDADMITPGSCANRYTIARKYHATDVCGNSSSMTQTITVDDQTAPSITSIPANTTVSCVSDVPAPNDGAVVATDGCGGAVTITHDADMITPGSCANRYTIARKYHATDVCGNSSSMTQTITVDDQIAPSITSIPANTTVSCVSDVPAPNDGAVVATDGCGGAVTITHDADMITPGSCANRYTIARKYHATDVCGNSSSMTQTITVDDQIAPSITSIPANTTVSCVSDVPAPNDGAVVATDGCGGAVTITHDADMITPGSCANRYTIARTYHATDVCGNSSSMTQTITVNDTTPPTITCPAPVAVQCAADVPAPNIASVIASDNCAGTVTVTHVSDVMSSSNCFSQFTLTRTYKATDVCGNMATCTQTITVNDTTAPTISCPAPVTVQCVGDVPMPNIGSVIATDNCAGTVTVTHVSDVMSSSNCFTHFTLTRTYKATDVCGNMATCTQLITVNDATAPMLGTVTGPAGPMPINSSVAMTNTFTDSCPQTHTVTFIWDDGTSTTVNVAAGGTSARTNHTYDAAGVYTIGVIVTDACGNSVTKSNAFEFIVIYDPSGGFVTGGGWINSPAGAYVANPLLTGKANFGFVSKYQKGATIPTGETEFQFQVGNLNFHSTSYQWLVISGPKAQYKGWGTINGAGNYGFLLTATDGDVNGGGGVDKFRIKIWYTDPMNVTTILYDNAPSSDDINASVMQALGGGSIVIHK